MCIADENCHYSYNKLYISKDDLRDDHSNLKSLSRFKQLVIRKMTVLRGKYINIIEKKPAGKITRPLSYIEFQTRIKKQKTLNIM